LAVITLATIYARLFEVAAPYRRGSASDGGTVGEIFGLRQELDEVENDSRANLGLAPVDSQNA
jgi:hypothetical protein